MVHSERSQVHFYQPKNQHFKGRIINKQQILFAIFFFCSIIQDVYVFYKVGGGGLGAGSPLDANDFFNNRTKWRLFLSVEIFLYFIFFYFFAGLPKSSKVLACSPDPENNYQCSPAP